MKTDVLILQHSKGVPPGTTIDWLKKNKLNYKIHFWGQDEDSDIEKNEFSFLIILGGPQNVDEEVKYPWLVKEKLFIKKILTSNIPILGLCLGGQLLADALGAPVRKHLYWELGWSQVSIFNSKSNLLPSQNDLTVFQFHGYSFEIPLSAERIATNSITQNQGFFYNDRVIGLQFHPEANHAWINQCAREVEEENYRGPYVQSREEIERNLYHQQNLQNWYFELLENFKKLAKI